MVTQLPTARDWMSSRRRCTESPEILPTMAGTRTTVGVTVMVEDGVMLGVCEAPVDHDAVALFVGLFVGVDVLETLTLEVAVIEIVAVIEGVAGIAGISQQ